MDKLFLRAFAERQAEPGKAGEPITFIASTEGVKRDGKELLVKRWNLDNYQRNPVFLWAHDYMGRNLPIGRSQVEVTGRQLKAAVTFDQADDFARQVETKYRNGFLNAVSVGWLDLARCKKCVELLDAWSYWGLEYLRKKCPHCEAELTQETVDLEYDLLDVSGVPVPGDPEALMEREYAALRSIMEERAGLEIRPTGERPYPNEHACRVKDPGDFEEDSFRRVKREHEGKEYSVIMGRMKGESTMTEQAYRYPKDVWSVSEARAHCKSHNGIEFSPASGEGIRAAIPPHTTEKADEGAAWDGPGEVAKCPAERGPLRRMHAWVDDDGDPDAKQSYKLPHHLAESGQVVWRGVAAAMARLLQAGTQIPDGDRRGVYNHLARHYKQFDKEAPEFRTLEELEALGEEEIRGLFLEGEEEWAVDSGQWSVGGGQRKGAVLSSRNKGDLEQAIGLIQGVLERAKKEEDGEGERETGDRGIGDREIETLQALNFRLSLIGGKGNG